MPLKLTGPQYGSHMEISCQRFRIFLSYRYSRPNDLNWSCAWFLSGGVTVSSAIGVRQIALDRDYGNCPSSNLRPQVEGAHSRCTKTQVYKNHLFTQTHLHTNTGVNTDALSGVYSNSESRKMSAGHGVSLSDVHVHCTHCAANSV